MTNVNNHDILNLESERKQNQMMMRPRSYGTFNRCIARVATHAINEAYAQKLRHDRYARQYSAPASKSEQDPLEDIKVITFCGTLIFLFIIFAIAGMN